MANIATNPDTWTQVTTLADWLTQNIGGGEKAVIQINTTPPSDADSSGVLIEKLKGLSSATSPAGFVYAKSVGPSGIMNTLE